MDVSRLFTPECHANPYPLYHELREEARLIQLESFGSWLATRYDEVLAVLRDPRFQSGFSLRYRQGGGDGWERRSPTTWRAFQHMMLVLNPPDHGRVRGLVSRAFTPRRVEELRPRVEALAEKLLDEVTSRGGMDVVADFAYPLPVTVIAELLGLPTEDRDRLRVWSRPLAQILDGPTRESKLEEAEAAGAELNAYLRGQLEAHRRRPGDDLIDGLLAAREAGDHLEEDELLASCMLLLIAGHETTTNLIASGILALMRHRREWERLRLDPELVPRAVEEMLRYDGPVQFLSRRPSENVELAGHEVPQDEEVLLLIGAANRDPDRFPDPDRFNVCRQEIPHLAFGLGPHFCLGASLARLEAQVAFGALLRRFPELALETAEVRYRPGFAIRAPESVRVRF